MTAGQAPRCRKCRRPHDPALRCWTGQYAMRLVRLVLATQGRVCHWCGRPGATSADHLRPRSQWGDDDLANLRPAHRRCNSERGARVISGHGARTVVVTGPPAAGKTRWVAEHAAPGDVVIDLGALAAALTPAGEVTPAVRDVALAAWGAAARRAARLADQVTVWLIHPHPSGQELADYTRVHAEVIVVDPGRDLVTARCRPEDLPAAARWYSTLPAPAPAAAGSGRSPRFAADRKDPTMHPVPAHAGGSQ